MTKVYKITYYDEFEHPDDIDIVKEGCLSYYANVCWQEGRISDDTIEDYLKKHETKPNNDKDASELLELDGYYVSLVEVYE
ncbi:MAG: hypothetical protein KBT03_09360 [Bacteroidales bacterium]|nr:hypothetical protein [Candidatus Scybalousia scybalohippi]